MYVLETLSDRSLVPVAMLRRILHVDLDAFFASVEQALNPELWGKPVVVGGEPRSRGVVAAASYEARRYGLRSGMPLSTAYRLCPHAVFLPGRFAHYRAASERFMAILAEYTPDLEPMGIDEAYLDLSGFEPLYGPASETARKIRERVHQELGITASVGIASCKVVAKVASDQAKPDGLLEVPFGQEAAFLAPLPLRMLPCVGPKTEGVLKRMGLATIGELADLPRGLLRATFGVVAETLHRWANGQDDSPVQPYDAPAKSVSRSTTLATDTLDRPLLRALLGYLSEKVAAELRRNQQRARHVVLKLRYADFQTVTRHATLPEPTDAQQQIYPVGWRLLERALAERSQLVRLLGVGVTGLVEGATQLSLVETWREQQAHLNHALDRVRRKYGFTALQWGKTYFLGEFYHREEGDYLLKTPALSR